MEVIMNWKLKELINEHFGSQSNFAYSIKTNESIVSKIVRGRRALSAEDQKKWANALGTKPENIFK
jgi:plasmid maintenance system antidote protein VapI